MVNKMNPFRMDRNGFILYQLIRPRIGLIQPRKLIIQPRQSLIRPLDL
ncbi:hypothetical protein ACIQZM_14900 [Peribacillus sp. NPDC097206]